MNPTRRGLLVGTAAAAATTALGGCATSGSDADSAGKGAVSAENPLGVPADANLEVVIFKGGYGDAYAVDAGSKYKQKFPKVTVDHKGIQGVGEVLQPRFVADNPPDVVDNSGAGRLDLATLVAAGKLKDLTELLDAPSLDDPSKKVRETLMPGVIEDGSFDGKPLVLNYSSVVWGIWYSKSLFAKHGWTFPKTWDEMLTLNDEIKKAGLHAWTWQGKYPEYLNDPLVSLAAKAGGFELVKAIDNLEPGAWKSPAMTAAAEAIYQLAVRGHIMPGSEGLSHTEAQNAWCKGQVAFIPCGSWLEGEQQAVTPAGFDMVMAPVPSLTSSDKLGDGAVMATSSESFLVPAKAKNAQGGLEFLRILFSKQVARGFAESAKSLPVVAGATDGLTLSSGLGSVAQAVAGAGANVFSYKFRTWYAPLSKAVDDATGELATKRINPAQWAERVQKAADAVAADSSIAKHKR
ncbi:N-acetylglucosamine/diacetylchitobiose ABC transporter substrate-binding protein [Catellatospora tritici]|uniref:N-acetylglucosamine/diacetylchitobiose ABC transporter substrate-binding protein n=1 Tax=Catellatospora tritici TaxID=2851566 RepID=UPI001C2DD88F|nr:N-acetylglucosamine/diacetylchitobiose ABC transporter substrate-binding protein [Catellatospora tritici]MBV1855325.1 N-acetylglucosamine/diacetylchitobiose ABC transporter substrate-binding protein [Catellatospora tritici]